MTDATSPFSEQEPLRLPSGLKIRHFSGTATELMAQLAPLLADEGIDVDQLEAADPAVFKAAMARAVERHNMELSTPIGVQRARAINTLRDLTLALHRPDPGEVQSVFASIGPVATRNRPSSGHLTGITMETLDALYQHEPNHPALHIVEIPQLEASTKAAAQHIVGLAAKGNAFRRLDDLLARYGSFEVSRAGIDLMAATIQAIASYRAAPFADVLDELVPEQSVATTAPEAGDTSSAEASYVEDFEAWLKSHPEVADIAAKITEIFASMLTDARHIGLNPHDPQDFDGWIRSVQDTTDPKYLVTALEIVKYYLQFRIRTDVAPEVWNPAHAVITELTVHHGTPPWDFEKIFDAAQQLDQHTRYTAMLGLQLVSGAARLHTWLATPREVTESGAPRRDDLHELGDIFGMDLHGVAQLPDPPRDGYVRSALEVPELMIWWWALEELGIIAVTAPSVQQGPAAQDFFGPHDMPYEGAEGIIATYVKIFLVHGLEHAPLEISSVGHTIARLLNSLQDLPPLAPPSLEDFRGQLVQRRSNQYLKSLEAFGLIERHDGQPRVPAGLQLAVFYGLMMAMDFIDEFIDRHLS